MKMFKRIAALALSAVMAAGLLATPAMATGERRQGSITVMDVKAGAPNYTAYRLFDLKLGENEDKEPLYIYVVFNDNPLLDFFKNGDGKEFVDLVPDPYYVNIVQPKGDFASSDPETASRAAADLARKALNYIKEHKEIQWKEETEHVAADENGYAGRQWVYKYTIDVKREKESVLNLEDLSDYTTPSKTGWIAQYNNVVPGYYLVNSSMGSLCAMDSTNFDAIIYEKNIEPQLVVNIWENYTDDGTYVNFNTKSADVGGTDYAAFSFGDTAYMTAEITIGNGEGTMDYLLRRCEYDGVANRLRPYHSGGFGYAESNLLSVAKWDEESGKWVKLNEGEGWMYEPVWEGSNFVFDSASGEFIWRDDPEYGLTRRDNQIWLNSFDLKPGDKVAVTWKYIAMGDPASGQNYGGWHYDESTPNGGWHQTYDNWKDKNGLGGYGCVLQYGVPDQAWKDWDEEKTYYQTTDGARKEGILGETLFKLEDTDGALYSGVQILKTDKDGNPLSGAEFELYWDEACTQPVYFAWNNYEDGDGRYYMSPDKAYDKYDKDVYHGIQPMIMEALDADGQVGRNWGYSGLYNAVCDVQRELFCDYIEDEDNWVSKPEYENFLNYGGDDEEFAAAIQLWENKLKEKGIVSATLKDDGHGLYTLVGLKPGTYYLKETKAPAGYNKLAEPEAITVKAVPYIFSYDEYDYPEGTEYNEMGYPVDPATDEEIEAQIPERLAKVDNQVVNFTGLELPHTGGIGTTIFYVVGGLLVVGAGILLVVKKRMNDQ